MKVTALESTCLRHKVDYYFQDLWPLEYLIQRLNFSVFFLPYFPTFEKLPVFSDLLQAVSQIYILSMGYLPVYTSNLDKHFVSSTS